MTYDGVQELEVNAGRGHDAIVVQGIADGTSLTVYAGTGNDAISVGTPTTPAMLAGPLDVRGQGGSDTLTINDQANHFSFAYTITSSTVTRSSSEAITYSSFASLVLNAGSG
jgi:hypothetical protein